ncbi:MAG: hypothetical protein P8X73_09655 [Ignavibacteriaceae bacterium]
MKNFLLIILLGILILSITSCYTQIAVQNDDNEDYYESVQPIIIVEPAPAPIIISPINVNPPQRPNPTKPPVYKERNTEPDRVNNEKNRDPLRNTGGRNNVEGKGRG